MVVALFAVEGAVVGADKVVARAAEEDVTLIETSYQIKTTEATEHVVTLGSSLAGEIVVTLGAAVEGVVGGVVAGAKRLNRQLRALSIGRIGYGPSLGHPQDGHRCRKHRRHRDQQQDAPHKSPPFP